MKLNWIKIFFIYGLILTISTPIYGRIQFTRMTAKEVYRALREAGRMDAVPEGRVVTQGIAAATGFIAGVAKGVGIPMLIGLAAGLGSTNSTNGGETQTQEICFSSRSALEVNDVDDETANEGETEKSDDDAARNENIEQENEEDDDEEESYIQGRQTPPPTTSAGPTTPPPATPDGTTQTTIATPTTGTTGASPTTTATVSPTGGTTGTATTGVDGTGSGTVSGTTTKTGTGGSVNCVVIQKPK